MVHCRISALWGRSTLIVNRGRLCRYVTCLSTFLICLQRPPAV
jgi:hypothetical protein